MSGKICKRCCIEIVEKQLDKTVQMQKVRDACLKANVPIPKEVINYLQDGGIVQNVTTIYEGANEINTPSWLIYRTFEDGWGFNIDLRKLSSSISFIRVRHNNVYVCEEE